MKNEALHIGMTVRHPQYGVGTVKTIGETTAEIQFNDGKRTIAPEAAGVEPADAQAAVSGLSVPLKQFIEETLTQAVAKLGLEKPDSVANLLGQLLQVLDRQLALVHQFRDEQAGAREGHAHHRHPSGGVGLRERTEQLAEDGAEHAQHGNLPACQKTARQHNRE